MRRLRVWMALATAEEQRLLASRAGTSRAYLYQLASGKRMATADLAGRIADEAEILRRGSKGRLPKLLRGELSSACEECPYARKCEKRNHRKV